MKLTHRPRKKTYKEYELDILGVEGPHKQTISSYRFWYEHIKKNAFKTAKKYTWIKRSEEIIKFANKEFF